MSGGGAASQSRIALLVRLAGPAAILVAVVVVIGTTCGLLASITPIPSAAPTSSPTQAQTASPATPSPTPTETVASASTPTPTPTAPPPTATPTPTAPPPRTAPPATAPPATAAPVATPTPTPAPVTFTLGVALDGNGAGQVSASPGIACPPSCFASYLAGTELLLVARPAATSLFAGWGGACAGTDVCRIVIGATTQVTATFSLPLLSVRVSGLGTVASDPPGIRCPTLCAASYPVGTRVFLAALAPAGQRFAGWSGACEGTASCVITLDGSKTVGAAFVTVYPLTLSKAGTGSGSVTSSPAGIACTSLCSTTSASFDAGTPVSLTAVADRGSVFSGWSGGSCRTTGPCVVSMTQAQSVTAVFTRLVTITVGISGLGAVTSSPAGVTCTSTTGSATCYASFPQGTGLTLTAAPAPGSYVYTWGGACAFARAASSCSLRLDAATSVSVIFVAVPR